MNPGPVDYGTRVPRAPTPLRRFLGWCVHAYTGLGLICAAGMAVLILEGPREALGWVFVLMLVATLIDATDGTLARAVHIKETVPSFDGRRLDDLIDYLTYTFLPLLLVWRLRAELLPPDTGPLLLFPLAASMYGFCQTQAKTDDGYFLGFPSYWNLVAFYLYALHMPPWLALGLLLLFGVLTFVPSRYLYPTMGGPLSRLTMLLGALWTVLLLVVVYRLVVNPAAALGKDSPTHWLTVASLAFPLWYLGVSWWVSLRPGKANSSLSPESEPRTQVAQRPE
jgi:phosphatidylcholine synthase